MNDDGSASTPDDEGRDDWRRDVPDPERIRHDRSRISDEEWDDLVRQIAEPSASGGDMPAEDVREALEDAEHWEPEPAEPIGWRTVSPTLVLSWAAALGAVVLLLIGLAVGIGGAVGLFFHLPSHRSADDGDGSSV